jgi:sugar lactone lactonase YvrE
VLLKPKVATLFRSLSSFRILLATQIVSGHGAVHRAHCCAHSPLRATAVQLAAQHGYTTADTMNKANHLLITLTSIAINLGAGPLALSTQSPDQPTLTESPASRTSINGPHGIAYDPAGFLFANDIAENKIVRLDIAHGTVTTISTPPGYSGDISVIAMDKDRNLFIANMRGEISKLDVSTGKFTSLRANDRSANAMFFSIAIDNSGGILVTGMSQLFRWTPEGLRVVAGVERRGFAGDGGPAAEAAFFGLMGVAVNADGDIFVVDSDSCRIRKIDSKTRHVSTIAGTGNCRTTGDNGPATNADLRDPTALICDREGNLFFAGDSQVRRIDRHGVISTYAGTGQPGFSGDGGVATHAQLDMPWGLAADESGNLYIADYVANRIRRVDAVTHVITTVAGDGSPKRIDVVL